MEILTEKKKQIYLSDLNETITEQDKNSIIKELELEGNIVIFGRMNAGKTVLLEALVREHLSLTNHLGTFYLTNYEEIDFSNEKGITSLEQAATTNVNQQISNLKRYGYKTVVFNEVNSLEHFEAVEYAIYSGMQVMFTAFGTGIEDFTKRLSIYLGEERAKKLMKHIPLTVLCERDLERNYKAKVLN